MMSVVVKLSKEVGVTPWTALGHVHRARELMWKGSDVAVWKLGPKVPEYCTPTSIGYRMSWV